MVVSTIYDKELKQKVFQVRDSERYTNSTLTSLEVTYQANNRNYLQLSLTATVQNHLGASSVVFYDGDEMLGTVVCNQGTSTVTCQARVSYGYHKLRAKYMGNAECLSSRSAIVEVEVDEPALARTYIDLTTADDYYFQSALDNPIGGALKLVDSDTGLASKTLKVFMDNERISTSTTDSNGGFGYSIRALDIGSHTIKFVFDGDDTNSACEVEHTFMYLKNASILDITPTHDKVSVGQTLSFDVVLSTYDGDPQSNNQVTLSLYGASGTIDEQRTDSDGKATLTTLVDSAGITYYEIAASNISEIIEIEVVDITSLDILSDNITSKGQTLPIAITAYQNASTVPNLLIYVDGTKYITDTNGQVLYNYNGTGYGNKSLTIVTGNQMFVKNIADTLLYFNKAQNKEYNFNFTVANSLSVLRKVDGLELASGNIEGSLFLYDNPMPVSWDLEFRVVSMSRGSSSVSSDFKVNDLGISDTILRNSPVIKVMKRDTVISVYYNDVLLHQGSTSQIYPKITAATFQTVVIDEVKLLKVNL